MRLCIICVCHNTHKEFDEYFSSIRRADEGYKADVVLLDNSTKASEAKVLSYKRLTETDKRFYYERVENLGYLGTAQQFLQTTARNFFVYDYLCISNVDLRLAQNLFVNLENAVPKNIKDVGMIAPRIITSNNLNKNPKIVNRPTRRNLQFRKFLFSSFLTHFLLEKLHILRKRFSRHKKRKSKFEDIYAAHGSFFLFAKPAFAPLTHEKYPVFLFGEEIFLAELMRKNQLKIYYMDNLVVKDSEHASTGKMKSSVYRKHNRDALQFILKYFF